MTDHERNALLGYRLSKAIDALRAEMRAAIETLTTEIGLRDRRIEELEVELAALRGRT